MKIKIEFTQEEKVAIADAVECPLVDDKKEGCKGKFGTVIYDPKGSIEFDIKSSFILAYVTIIKSAVLLIKSFMVTFEHFTKEWLEDIEPIEFEEKKEKDLHCPVERLKKDNENDSDLSSHNNEEPIIDHSVLTEKTDELFNQINNSKFEENKKEIDEGLTEIDKLFNELDK